MYFFPVSTLLWEEQNYPACKELAWLWSCRKAGHRDCNIYVIFLLKFDTILLGIYISFRYYIFKGRSANGKPVHIKGEEGYSAEYRYHVFASVETPVVEHLRKCLFHFILLHLKWMHCFLLNFHTNNVLRLLRCLNRNNCVRYILLNILLPFIKYSCLIFVSFESFLPSWK